MPATSAWRGSSSINGRNDDEDDDEREALLKDQDEGGGAQESSGLIVGGGAHSINGGRTDDNDRGDGHGSHGAHARLENNNNNNNEDEPLLELASDGSSGHIVLAPPDAHNARSLSRWKRVLACVVAVDVAVTIACELVPNPFSRRSAPGWWHTSLAAGGPAEIFDGQFARYDHEVTACTLRWLPVAK